MKKLFRKAITVLGSVALVGATIGGAAAASYPAPFNSGSYAVVYGAGSQDAAAASTIANDLPSTVGGTTGSVTGSSANLASGSDFLYLNDEFSENIQTLTKFDLPTVLADGTFTNDEGTDYDFEQKLVIGTSTNNAFAFGNTDSDLDDPVLLLDLSRTATATNGIYDLTASFNTAVPFNASDSEGEDLTLFGKTYTVGTATDGDTLVLLGGAGSAIINVGETQTIVVEGISYTVVLNGLSSAATTQASITVNGETKTYTEGQSKTVGGVDAYVKTVFRTGDDGSGYVEIQLGSGKLTLENGNAVQIGSDSDDIDGTLVTITGGVNAMTELTITVAAEDNDVNHLLLGGSFVDPVFGTVIVTFDSITNGPTFSGQKDTGRTPMEIRKGGNRELQLVLTDNAGDTQTVPFTFQGALSDDSSKTISIVEGASISDDGYFILNSGNNQHFMQITKLNMVSIAANSDVAMKDIISGDTYTFDNHDFGGGYSATIATQTYTITNDSATTVTITSSDYGTGIADGNDVDVFPYIELVSGEDTRVAFTDDVLALDELITGTAAITVTLNLPTGTVNVVTSTTADTVTIGGTAIANAANASVLVGDVYYDFAVADGTAVNASDITVGVAATPSTAGTGPVTTPGILFVEDEDKSESTSTTKPAIHIVTTEVTSGSSTYSTVSTPLFTGVMDTETWDNTDYVGWMTNYGTYVWRNTGDSNQNFVGLSYGDDMMYANVIIAEGEASTSDSGVVSFMDSQSSSYAGRNIVVVGGSCINSVAAALLGGAYCGDAFTGVTTVGPGQFLVQSFDYNGKIATLIAGYEKDDTSKGATYLANEVDTVSTDAGMKYIGQSATESAVLVS